jgi:hypothetical protein
VRGGRLAAARATKSVVLVSLATAKIPFVNRDDVVGIGLRVVAAKFGEFGYVTLAVAAFDVEQEVEGVGDLGLNCPVGNFDTGL